MLSKNDYHSVLNYLAISDELSQNELIRKDYANDELAESLAIIWMGLSLEAQQLLSNRGVLDTPAMILRANDKLRYKLKNRR